MKNNLKNNLTINSSNKHLFDPRIQKAFELVNGKGNEMLFPEKYYSSLFSLLKKELNILWEKEPEKPMRDVVTHFIGQLNKNIKGNKILEITNLIVTHWQTLQEKNAIPA